MSDTSSRSSDGSARGKRDAGSAAPVRKVTDSGIEVAPLYDATSLAGFDPAIALGAPGAAPYTRGVYPKMHRERL